MPTDVIMPQMGESIVEGTIVRWRRGIGDVVERDDPLFDIATDKVDTEVPAAVTGRLTEILVPEGETVEVNTVVARITEEGEEQPVEAEAPTAAPTPEPPPEPAEPSPPVEVATASEPPAPARRRPRSSPLVRRIAREQGVELTEVTGTGSGGRITKDDILAFVAQRGAAPEPAVPIAPSPAPDFFIPPAPSTEITSGPKPAPQEAPQPAPEAVKSITPAAAIPSRTEPLTHMRRAIAEHMVRSRRVAAHVTTVFEVDVTSVVQLRQQVAAGFEERTGVRLTLTPFFAKTAVDALADFPILNASITDEEVIYHQAVNLGVAVALPDGLIVPVIERADERNFVGLARRIHDVAGRARRGELRPEEVQGGTFSITNPGRFGSLFGTPIIAQPQVAILAVGGVHKRPVVVAGDAIAVRSMVLLSLSFDHRLVDGAVADGFMASVKSRLETWAPGALGMALAG